ncbi:hypothetical protein DENIS_3042 [Desulfonema ishimotonii]|uniref:Uncharacterized protein n=1 Tax=Desulfonema ishimotonii TaxID=45657 RepID=A0A401FYN3_9BACT|nr:hypothetical protein [Desulfonema ishimotonii]GBC62079.1 hypothetical protein DENIS_3042 [Desulfonema ishimotonii]
MKENQTLADMTYCIPVSAIGSYRHQQVIIRAADPSDFAEYLTGPLPERTDYLRITSLAGDPGPLAGLPPSIAVDLVIRDTASETHRLYDYASQLRQRPLRVSVPAEPGFSGAVRLAASLALPVRLDIVQPDADVTEELGRVLHDYLHQTTVTQPVEFFHSLLFAFYHRTPLTLWEIQEEDPRRYRHIADSGEESDPGRLRSLRADAFPPEQAGECLGCRFFSHCAGFFKHPDPDFSCAGVLSLLDTLRAAAEEIREDMARFGGTVSP